MIYFLFMDIKYTSFHFLSILFLKKFKFFYRQFILPVIPQAAQVRLIRYLLYCSPLTGKGLGDRILLYNNIEDR